MTELSRTPAPAEHWGMSTDPVTAPVTPTPLEVVERWLDSDPTAESALATVTALVEAALALTIAWRGGYVGVGPDLDRLVPEIERAAAAYRAWAPWAGE